MLWYPFEIGLTEAFEQQLCTWASMQIYYWSINTDDVTIVTLQVYNPHCLSEGKIGDYCDGSQCKAHPLFSTDPYALQIQLYYDDMEVCNPFGSNVKRHKLGKLHCLHVNLV